MPKPATPPVIQLHQLSKQYPGVTSYALHNVSLGVKPGEVYGFLGPNGAGKSTTIRCLLNFIQPTSGSAQILGQDIVQDATAVKNRIGYLAGDVALYSRMTGKQLLDFLTELQPPKHAGFVRTLVRDFRAELSRPLSELSKGNRQKIGIIQAFMHEPDVLILDEPTSGLDPLMQEVFYKLVADSKARGASLFISSHNLPEVQRMCDRIGFIRSGKLVVEQSIADLAKSAANTFDITFVDVPPHQELKRLPRARFGQGHDPRHVTIVVEGDLSALFALLAKHKVAQFTQREANLEAEFLRLYQKGRRK